MEKMNKYVFLNQSFTSLDGFLLFFQGCPKVPSKISFCLDKEYECGDRLTCIHKSWLCDGTKDCPDGTDEAPENCQNITCRVDQFQCKDRSCITGHLHCNGHADCPDGSDEEDCGKYHDVENIHSKGLQHHMRNFVK